MILFINPKTNVNPDIPNLQLVYSATIEHNKGKETKIIDLNTLRTDETRYLDERSEKVRISIRPFSQKQSQEIAKNYLKKYPKSEICSVSGIIDVLCCYSFLSFENKKLKTVQYKEKFNDKLPFPNYELLDSFEVFKNNWQSGQWNYTIMTSLGCPYQCIYCSSRNRGWTARSAKNCYEELKQAKEKYGIKQFALLDDCFNFDKKRVLEFCRLIKPLNLKWLCTNGIRADRFDEDIAKAMAESGCIHIGFGAESYNQEIMNAIKKGLTIKQLNAAVDIAKKYFKNTHVFFIIGLPGSTYETDLSALRWAIKKGISAHFSYFVPFGEDYSDEAFYGDNAKPVSNTYPKELQEKIYKMTASMRGDYNKGFFNAVIDRLRLIWMFDKWRLPGHVWEYCFK